MSVTVDDRKQAEEAVLSFAFTAPAAFGFAMSELQPGDFSDPDMGNLFAVLGSMADAVKSTTDLRAVALELKQRGALQHVGGYSFIASIAGKGYAVANVAYYVAEIKRMSRLDRINRAAELLALGSADLTADPDQVMATFEQMTQTAMAAPSSVCTLADAAEKAMAIQREARDTGVKMGIQTGFQELDVACGGLFRGQLVLLSGRTYTGKTTFALNLAHNLADNGSKVAIHCLEMKDYELAERFLCAEARIELNAFATGELLAEDFDKADEAIQRFRGLPLWLHDSVSETVTTIRGKAKYHQAKHGLDVVFIDHLQRLGKRDPRQERYIQLNEDVRALKDLARELDCVVVLLTQLKVNEREDSEPSDADYAEARQIRQEADLAMILHRKKDADSAKLILNKVRKGGSGEIELGFDGPHQRFYGMEFATEITAPVAGVPWTGDFKQ